MLVQFAFKFIFYSDSPLNYVRGVRGTSLLLNHAKYFSVWMRGRAAPSAAPSILPTPVLDSIGVEGCPVLTFQGNFIPCDPVTTGTHRSIYLSLSFFQQATKKHFRRWMELGFIRIWYGQLRCGIELSVWHLESICTHRLCSNRCLPVLEHFQRQRHLILLISSVQLSINVSQSYWMKTLHHRTRFCLDQQNVQRAASHWIHIFLFFCDAGQLGLLPAPSVDIQWQCSSDRQPVQQLDDSECNLHPWYCH